MYKRSCGWLHRATREGQNGMRILEPFCSRKFVFNVSVMVLSAAQQKKRRGVSNCIFVLVNSKASNVSTKGVAGRLPDARVRVHKLDCLDNQRRRVARSLDHTFRPEIPCTRQHTSAYVSIRQHTSAYVSTRQHTSAYLQTRDPLGI